MDRSFAQFLDRAHHHALSRRLDRALALLERFGYVDMTAWRLTPRGEMLAGIYHESDLLVAEALAEGIFDGLDAPELAAVVSSCTFETRPGSRSGAGVAPQGAAPETGRDGRGGRDACAPRSRRRTCRAPGRSDDGFADVAWRWARGQRLDRVLERAELAPGDFVRNVKQLIDLLRQLAVVGVPDTAAAARQAADLLQRGVVAASAGPAFALDESPADASAAAADEATPAAGVLRSDTGALPLPNRGVDGSRGR